MKFLPELFIPSEKYITKKLHSEGSQGIVFIAYSHINHETVAVKVEKERRNNQSSIISSGGGDSSSSCGNVIQAFSPILMEI